MVDELSGHLPGLPSLKLSGIGAHVTMLVAKGKQRGIRQHSPPGTRLSSEENFQVHIGLGIAAPLYISGLKS
jgi:hypothetical protein